MDKTTKLSLTPCFSGCGEGEIAWIKNILLVTCPLCLRRCFENVKENDNDKDVRGIIR